MPLESKPITQRRQQTKKKKRVGVVQPQDTQPIKSQQHQKTNAQTGRSHLRHSNENVSPNSEGRISSMTCLIFLDEKPPPVRFDRKPVLLADGSIMGPKLPPRPSIKFSPPPPLQGSSLFDWNLSRYNKDQGLELWHRLTIKHSRERYLKQEVFFTEIKEAGFGDPGHIAESVWNLLNEASSSILYQKLTSEFCAYFLHLLEAVSGGKSLPRRIPINIRTCTDQTAKRALSKFTEIQSNRTFSPTFTQIFIRIRNSLEQAQLLVPFLELWLERRDFKPVVEGLRAFVEEQTHLRGLAMIGDQPMSDLLATLISNYPYNDDAQQQNFALQLFELLVRLSELRTSGFAGIFRKLEGLQVPTCFALILHTKLTLKFSHSKRYESDMEDIWDSMQTYCNIESSLAILSMVWLVTMLSSSNSLVPVTNDYMSSLLGAKWAVTLHDNGVRMMPESTVNEVSDDRNERYETQNLHGFADIRLKILIATSQISIDAVDNDVAEAKNAGGSVAGEDSPPPAYRCKNKNKQPLE